MATYTSKEAALLLWWHHTQGMQEGVCDKGHPQWINAMASFDGMQDNLAHKIIQKIDETTPQGQAPVHSKPIQDGLIPRLPPMDTHESKAHALKKLRQWMEDFSGCPLSKTAISMVFGEGDPNSPLMLVGEAPGAEEDKAGRPFVGMSGQLLTLMLESIGYKREAVYISNVVPWRPPFNRQPSSSEIDLCLPFIERHIHIIKPKILICLGGVATKSLLRTTQSITSMQGKTMAYTLGDPLLEPSVIPAFALYHPAYLLRSPGQKRTAWHQLLAIKHLLSNLC